MARQYEPTNTSDHLFVRVFVSRVSDIDQGWNARNVCSSFWRLYVNNRDGASVQWSGGRYKLTGDRVHLIPAWVTFDCHNTRAIKHFYIHYDLIGLPGTVVRELFNGPVTLAVDSPLRHLLRETHSSVAACTTLDLATLCQVKSLVYSAMSRLIHRLPPEQRQRCERMIAGHDPVTPAIRHIEDHLSESLPNHLLAQLCHLSEDHFIRRFRECVGQTPAQYVLERRISAAALRLLFTGESIKQIAQDMGFPDRFYFTRVFTRRMGVSPAAYRRTRWV